MMNDQFFIFYKNMHKINNTKVLILGPKNFNTSLEELKDYLNFKFSSSTNKLNSELFKSYDILFFHQDYLKGHLFKNTLKSVNKIKIIATNNNKINTGIFNYSIFLPLNINDLNNLIENSIVKKSFSQNSSIKIKDYTLDKNEKKLIRNNSYILLTEKEIQLLELFLISINPTEKKQILKKVWKYSTTADTHTVETHIYRLRKKIKDKFSDDNFILNNKSGYLL